jgi:hypothetical protein
MSLLDMSETSLPTLQRHVFLHQSRIIPNHCLDVLQIGAVFVFSSASGCFIASALPFPQSFPPCTHFGKIPRYVHLLSALSWTFSKAHLHRPGGGKTWEDGWGGGYRKGGEVGRRVGGGGVGGGVGGVKDLVVRIDDMRELWQYLVQLIEDMIPCIDVDASFWDLDSLAVHDALHHHRD